MSPIGTIVPEERRVVVGPTISTIIQFRIIDWGMEDCELTLSLPAMDHGTYMKSVTVVLHRLNQTYPLDLTTLSYQSRPPHVSKVASIQLTQEVTVWQRRFRCTSDGVLTFELASSELNQADFLVEWWQKAGYTEPHPGK
ncbi:hypothetical protein B0H13DRAFT_1675804 [Mycena leptocephala]|nr:hypothetical protein B0H13DRAFT_1675804 [Mycena leptocephala]